jgi:hypothetical protein
VAEAEGGASAPAERIAGLDTSVAHPARVYDYWLGGKDNFAADREAAERVLAVAPGHEDPWGIVARLMAATPAGSYLTISHPAIDIHHAQVTAQRVYNERVSTPQTLRTREQVARFFTGLDLVEPGLVQVHQWRPDPDDFAPEGVVSAHGGVARKAGA